MKDKIICIYKITSPSGKIYIGQTRDYVKRMRAYKNGYLKGQTKLYHSVLKHGWHLHTVDIIKECLELELNDLEMLYIKDYNSFNSDTGLNLSPGGLAGYMSEETKSKLSLLKKGVKMSPEARLKMSLAKKGTPSHSKGIKFSEERKKKLSASLKGRKMSDSWKEGQRQRMMGNIVSEESKRKIIAFHTGRKRSPETCAKIKASLAGKTLRPSGWNHTEETLSKLRGRKRTKESREKISAAAKLRYANGNHPRIGSKLSQEAKDKIGNANRGNKPWLGKRHSEETKLKISLSKVGKTGRKQSPETIAKRVASFKKSRAIKTNQLSIL